MIQKNSFPQRKSNRLKNYDYSQNGAYFLTVCAKNREEIFSRIVPKNKFETNSILTQIGKTIENEIQILSKTYENIRVDSYVIMPNHLHLILFIESKISDCVNHQKNKKPAISNIMNQFKRSVSLKTGFSVWQKSFHDHVIRDEMDYVLKANYVNDNPANWLEDELNQNKIF
jgi:REP element-mobilizing transposase RayT